MVKAISAINSHSVYPVKCLTQETDLDKSSYKRCHSEFLHGPRGTRLISTAVCVIKYKKAEVGWAPIEWYS